VGGTGRKVRGEPVHADANLSEIIERRIEIVEANAQMRFALPAPCVVAMQPRTAHHLDRKAEPPWFLLLSLARPSPWRQRARESCTRTLAPEAALTAEGV